MAQIAATIVTSVVTGLAVLVSYGVTPATASSNNFTVVAGTGGAPYVPGPAGTAALSVGFARPSGIGSDPDGNLLIADSNNNEIDLEALTATTKYDISGVTTAQVGDIYVLAGGGTNAPSVSGFPGNSIALNDPSAAVIDNSGNVLIADTHNNEIEVLAESVSNPGYVISGSWIRGDLYVIAGGGTNATTVGGTVATSASLNGPLAIAVTPNGNVVVADSANNEVDLLAVSGGGRTLGDLYVIAGGGASGAPSTTGLTATQSTLNFPNGLAVDSQGNVAIADSNHNAVDLLAESVADPGFGIGSSWNVGNIYRIVGGGGIAPSPSGNLATASALNAPQGIAFDANENLVIADVFHHEVEVDAVSSTDTAYSLASSTTWAPGDLYVIAGGGSTAPSASGSVALQTHLFSPIGVTTESSGSVEIVDQGSYLVEQLGASISSGVTTSTSGVGTSTTTLSGTVTSSTLSAIATSNVTTSIAFTTQNSLGPVPPKVTLLGRTRSISVRYVSIEARCRLSMCRGVVSVDARESESKKIGAATETVIKIVVVARSAYSLKAGRTSTLHVSWTKLGPSFFNSLPVSGESVLVTATVRGGKPANHRLTLVR